MNGTIMNSKRERQTLTTRYLRGRGFVAFAGVTFLTLLSSVKLIFLTQKDYYSSFPKETSELKFRLRFYLNFSCKLQSSP